MYNRTRLHNVHVLAVYFSILLTLIYQRVHCLIPISYLVHLFSVYYLAFMLLYSDPSVRSNNVTFLNSPHYIMLNITALLYFRNVFRFRLFPESIRRNPISRFLSRFVVFTVRHPTGRSVDRHSSIHPFVE